MVRYRRNILAGGTYFFTITLFDRGSSVLTDHVTELRAAFRATRRERPFEIDALVILPDHLHAVLTLPSGDADFSGRWRRINGHFSSHLIAIGVALDRHSNGELALWQRRFWSTRFVTTKISHDISTTFISIPRSTDLCHAFEIGRILPSIIMCDGVCCRMIGAAM